MSHKRALDISPDLVHVSDRNLVYYFREEIRAGALSGIPTGARKRLVEMGLIMASRKRGQPGSGYMITPYGERLLREADLDPGPSESEAPI